MNARRSLCASKDKASSRTPRNSSPVIESLESRVLLNADWTILVYMDGDNSLDAAALADINEMEMVGSSSNVNIIVQCDFSSSPASSDIPDTDNTFRARIQQDTDPDEIYQSEVIIMGYNPVLDKFWGTQEINMGDPDSLVDFITWGMSNYAADHYAVILWDHGGGIEGVCWDDTDNNDYLTLDEIDQAFFSVNDLMGAEADKIDLIGFDACLMGMAETAYELAPYADVMVGAEALEPGQGWDYNGFLSGLKNNSSMTAKQLGSKIVSSYKKYYESYVEERADAGWPYDGVINLSAIDLTRVRSEHGLGYYLDTFITETVTTATETEYLRLLSIRNKTYPYDGANGNFRDLGVFLSSIVNDTTLSKNENIYNAAYNALQAYNRTIIANANVNGTTLMNGTGMSIYLPDPDIGASSMYLNSSFDFVDYTQWDVFLDWWDDMEAAGTITGTVFDDANGNGVQDIDEVTPANSEGLLNDTCYVYLDTNGNGTYDGWVAPDPFTNSRTKRIVGALTTSTIEVEGMNQYGRILDVNVTIDASKTDLRYYTFTLVSPDGEKRIVLSQRLSNSTNLDNTTFDDGAENSIDSTLAEAPYTGSFKPIGNLAYLNGLAPDGEWTLEILDSRGLGGGTLREWSLELIVGEPTAEWDSSTGEFTFNNVQPGEYSVGIVNDPASDYFTGVLGTSNPNPSVTVANETLFQNINLAAILGGFVEGYTYNVADFSGVNNCIVFADKDYDGYLDDDESFTFTESDGYYVLSGLYPGETYTICCVSSNAYELVTPPASVTFTIESGDYYYNVNFGYVSQPGENHKPEIVNATYDEQEEIYTVTITIDEDTPTILDQYLANYFSDLEANTLYGPENGSEHLTYEIDSAHQPQSGTVEYVPDTDGNLTCVYTNADRYYNDPTSEDEPWDIFWVRAVDQGDPFGSLDGVTQSDYVKVIVNINEKNDAPDCPDHYLTVQYDGNPIDFTLLSTDEETAIGNLTFEMLSGPVLLSVDPSLPLYQNSDDDERTDMEIGSAGRVDLDGNQATLYFAEQRVWQNTYIMFTYQVTDVAGSVANDPDAKTTIGTVYITLTPPAGDAITVTSGYTVRYHEQDGSVVNVKIANGQALLFFAGQDISFFVGKNNVIEVMGSSNTQLYDIQLVKSSLKTSINVTAKGGDNLATIGSIRGESALGRFNGRCVELSGAGVEMTGAGYIRNLYLNNVTGGADILMSGVGGGMTMSLGAIETGTTIGLYSTNADGEIIRYNHLASFSAVSWAGGTFTANSVGTFRITGSKTQAGNLNADLILTSQGVGLGSIRVAGEVTGGTWILGKVIPPEEGQEQEDTTPKLEQTNGTSIGSIVAGSLSNVSIYAGGGVRSVQAGKWRTGSINANWLQTLKIIGNNRNIESGTLGADITLNGSLNGYSLMSAYVSNKIIGGTWDIASNMKTLKTIAGATGGAEGWTVTKIGGNVGSITSGGSFGGNININGTVGTVRAMGTYVADMVVNGVNSKGLSINQFQVGRSNEGNLTVKRGIGSIRAGEWLDGMIKAAYINSLQTAGRGVSGDMTADITLEGQNNKGRALGYARIQGDWNGTINNTGLGSIGPFYEGGKLIVV